MNNFEENKILNSINVSAITNIAKIESDLQNWSIPKESFNTIYHTGKFDFIKNYNIKTCESTIAINNSIETIKLLAAQDIQQYRKKYNFLHVGLVQVAVKPLYRLGLDTPLCLLLRDDRLLNFDDSLLGVLQSNLAQGPVYFNCYPNYSVDINDQNILDTLTLNIKTKHMNSKINTKEIAVIYRVYYRLMKTTLAPKAKIESNKGITMLMEANQEHSNTFVPRMIRWDEILSKDEWHFDAITQPRYEPESSYIEQVTQHPSGAIDLKFLRSNSQSETSSSRRMSFSRPSSSKPPEGSYSNYSNKSDEELIEELDRKIRGVDFNKTIPKVIYQKGPFKTEPKSPDTETVDHNDQLGVIKEDNNFKIDWKNLGDQWNQPDCSIKIQWYFEIYTKPQRLSFKDKWIKDMKRIRCNIEFFKWFELTGQIPNQQESLQMIINKWYTKKGTIIEATTPPLEEILIPIQGQVITASPFKRESIHLDSEPTNKDLNKIITQNNYTNNLLYVVSNQLKDTNKIETPIRSKKPNTIETHPTIKIPEFSKEKFPKLKEQFDFSDKLLEKIEEQLKTKMTVSKPSTNQTSTSNDKTIELHSLQNKLISLEEEYNNLKNSDLPNKEDKMETIQKASKIITNSINKIKPLITLKAISVIKPDDSEVNRITNDPRHSNKKNYYQRASFPDVQFEEDIFLTSSNHDGTGITEWNIDGLAESQIYKKLHEIGIAVTAYKMKNASDKHAATLIISGFTGTLKNWWDNYLSEDSRNQILNATAIITVVKTENNVQIAEQEPREDATATLIYCIAKHFIGEPKLFQDRSLELLNNLSCPKLTDFRWYKDMFIEKVMIREDCGNSFWKERFISGLPRLFAEKVRTKIKDRFNGQIPYDNLTYGDLISFINVTGLDLCTDLKLKSFIKKDKLQSKRELGSFCQDFGYTKISAPSKRVSKKNKSSNKPHRRHHKQKEKREEGISKKRFKRRSKKEHGDKCWTCGKTGHRASDCKVTRKKKNKVNLLELDENTKEKLYNILEENDNSSSSAEESYTDSDNELINVAYSSESSSSEDNNCNCTGAICICDQNSLRVITNDSKEVLFDIINHIDNDDIKKKYLIELKNIILQHKDRPKIEPFNMKEVMNRFSSSKDEPTIQHLQTELKSVKEEIKNIKTRLNNIEMEKFTNELLTQIAKGKEPETNNNDYNEENNDSIIDQSESGTTVPQFARIKIQSYHIPITLRVKNATFNKLALLDSGADRNCICEGIIPTKYLEKSTTKLYSATGERMKINYKLSKAHICNDGICFINDFVITRDINEEIILGLPFITQIKPYYDDLGALCTTILGKEIKFPYLNPISQEESNFIKSKTIFKINILSNQVKYLQNDIKVQKIEQTLRTPEVQTRIKQFQQQIELEVCSDLPNAFWQRKRHIIELPYIKDFNEQDIPTKARPIQMNHDLMETCKKEINDLLQKKIIKPSKSPWSCAAFYVINNAEKERGAPRLVINYKPLNKVLQWIRYPIPNKRDLLKRTYKANIYSKFDMKSGFWQIQIAEKDKYKTAFNVPFGQYEWNVMPFGLKNAPSEFQNIMNNIFNPYSNMSIVYIDDVLIFSEDIESHFKHLNTFLKIIKHNGLVVSSKKIKLFQTAIRFLGHDLHQGTYKPICRAIEFSSKFPDEITDKTQLQRFLGSLNYVADFIPDIRKICEPLYKRLRKNPIPWSLEQTNTVRKIKAIVQKLPCLGIPNPEAFMIVETDASNEGYGGILKQQNPSKTPEQLVRFTSGIWNSAQKNYSTVKKEILSIVLCITKFQDDLINKEFLLRVDCKSAKEILQKDVKNIVSKQIFARWQALLSSFNFEIEFIKGENNSLPDFLTREFLQGKNETKSEGSVQGLTQTRE